jgi:hypothetical protein
MKSLLKIVGCVSLALVLNILAQAKEWRGIIPLHSTRADVERLLGSPIDDPSNKGIYLRTYRTEEERITILYSDGPHCNGYLLRGYRVPEYTVVTIIVRAVVPFPFSDLKLDKAKFKESSGGHVSNYSNFTNKEEGISYEVLWKADAKGEEGRAGERQGVVTSVEYSPRAKDKHVQCPEPPPERDNLRMPTANGLKGYRKPVRLGVDVYATADGEL